MGEPALATHDTPQLPLAVFQFSFDCEDAPALPAYAGSAWRGAFGRALKKTVCVARHTDCPDCLLYRTCVYPYVFETPPPPDARKMRRYTAAPHPFVLRIDPRWHGSPYRLGLALFGRAGNQLPYFVHALEQAGRAGLGSRRQAFELTEVHQGLSPDGGDWRLIHTRGSALRPHPPTTIQPPPLPEVCEIRLETPLRLQRESHLVTPAGFRFADLFGTLLRRISMLTYFHTDTPLETDFAGLKEASRAVPIHSPDLSWYDWTRYSSRQEAALDMGGLLGRFRLRGEEIEPFWPYLWLGQWTHAGKGTSMGLGQYSIQPASLPERP